MKPAVRRAVQALALACATALASVAAPGQALAADEVASYAFGVVPQFDQRKLHTVWSPIVAELGRRTGLRFRLITTLSLDAFGKEIGDGAFDFVYTNPYHVLMTRSYQPLVADSAPLRGIVVVRRDDPVRELKALDGQVVAFPSPNAIGASLLIRADLERLFHVTVKPLYVNTHSSVYLHVAKGLAAAGGGVEKSLSEQDPAVRDALRVLYTTRSIPSHPVAGHDRVPAAHRELVRAALLAMDATPEGRSLLAEIPSRQLVPVSMASYQELRGWGLEAYWVEPGKEARPR
jgi:phosphonate transport system substrate-binding protein